MSMLYYQDAFANEYIITWSYTKSCDYDCSEIESTDFWGNTSSLVLTTYNTKSKQIFEDKHNSYANKQIEDGFKRSIRDRVCHSLTYEAVKIIKYQIIETHEKDMADTFRVLYLGYQDNNDKCDRGYILYSETISFSNSLERNAIILSDRIKRTSITDQLDASFDKVAWCEDKKLYIYSYIEQNECIILLPFAQGTFSEVDGSIKTIYIKSVFWIDDQHLGFWACEETWPNNNYVYTKSKLYSINVLNESINCYYINDNEINLMNFYPEISSISPNGRYIAMLGINQSYPSAPFCQKQLVIINLSSGEMSVENVEGYVNEDGSYSRIIWNDLET